MQKERDEKVSEKMRAENERDVNLRRQNLDFKSLFFSGSLPLLLSALSISWFLTLPPPKSVRIRVSIEYLEESETRESREQNKKMNQTRARE